MVLINWGGVPYNVGTSGPLKTESDKFTGTFMGRLIHAVPDEVSEISHKNAHEALLLGSARAKERNNEIANSGSMV